jgi:hypothetical protein
VNFHRTAIARVSTDESRDVERLVARLRELGPLEARPPWGRASARYDHMGAKLADAVLQSGVGYEVFVRPRVDRIVVDYPTGRTTSGFLLHLHSDGPTKVLNLRCGRKLRTIVELATFLINVGVETTADLRSWLQVAGHSPLLMTVHGVGPKTVSFLKLLVGLDAIAVDRQVLRFVQEASVDLKAPELVEAILTKAGKQLGLSGADVDQLVWRSMAARKRRVAPLHQ